MHKISYDNATNSNNPTEKKTKQQNTQHRTQVTFWLKSLRNHTTPTIKTKQKQKNNAQL